MEFFSRNKKGLLFYLEHDFLCYFDREQIEKKIAFFDQNKGKRLLKIIILGLYYQKCFFATKIIIKHYFLWYF